MPLFAPVLFWLSAFLLTGLAVLVARKLRLLAHPVERSSHSSPTPQVGGVGLCLAYGGFLSFVFFPGGMEILPLCLLIMLLWGLSLGLVDDVLHLGALIKLAGQFVLAAIPLGFGFLPALFGEGHLALTLGGAFLFGWILFFVNAFNFMDGVNGQSGFYSLFALLAWVGLFFLLPPPMLANAKMVFVLLLFLMLAILGFLPWNFPRALTFLGDSGSLPLGALLAFFVVLCGQGLWLRTLLFFIPLAFFCYDVVYTLARRWRRGENLLTAHRSHLYQRLLIATGWSHGRLLLFHLPFWLGGVANAWLGGLMLRGQLSPFAVISVVVIIQALFCGLYTAIVLNREKKEAVA